MRKWWSNYKVRENELGQKKDHPKDPPNNYQWWIESQTNHLEWNDD